VSQASSGAITRRAAVEEARGFVRQRVEVLDAVVNLKAPAGFGHAHQLLAESLRLSIDDDRALVNWAIDRRDGGSGRAQFAEANRLGIKAGVAKKTFLSAYRSARAAVGLDSASLPAQY